MAELGEKPSAAPGPKPGAVSNNAGGAPGFKVVFRLF